MKTSVLLLTTSYLFVSSILPMFFNYSISVKFYGSMETDSAVNPDSANPVFPLMVSFASVTVLPSPRSYTYGLDVTNYSCMPMLFVMSTGLSITMDNFYRLMVGWDGLGAVSSCLTIYYTSKVSTSNGIFTSLQNRLGDTSFTSLLIFTLDSNCNSVVFTVSLLIIGCMVKSAQHPFNSWLLAAMSAPTPISSLVHSSTPAAAGVYVSSKFSDSLSGLETPMVTSVMSVTASTSGSTKEMDTKKPIAYSTMNHVSMMTFPISLGLSKTAYLHLNVHAMSKSLLSMSFGYIMTYSFHGQDSRMISISFLSPVVLVTSSFSGLCLAGLPMSSASFLKDSIIERLYSNSFNLSLISLLLINPSLSVFYTTKIFLPKFIFGSSNNMKFYSKLRISVSFPIMMSVSSLSVNSMSYASLMKAYYKVTVYLSTPTFMMFFFKPNFYNSNSGLKENFLSVRSGFSISDSNFTGRNFSVPDMKFLFLANRWGILLIMISV